MADIDWNALTLAELKSIEKKAAKAIESFEARKKQEALAALEARATEMGYSLKGLLGATGTKPTKSPPKHMHPENPSLTWTGRGRQPKWIKEGLSAGKSLEDFAIASS
ncbi:MAG: H-NS histone family protein [Pseudomonadota bacterium]